jgi:prepilin-type N-terminal cleavage/methylation domain-containing protein
VEKKMKSRNNSGLTITELVIAIAIIGIISLFAAPQIGLMRSNYNVRSCATDLIQNIRTVRAMAIKENREYIIAFNPAGQMY